MIIEIIILLLAIPLGLLIAKLTKDEMKQGRIYFRIIEAVSVIGIVLFWIIGLSHIAYSFGFILIVSMVSSQKTKAVKKVKKRSFK